ncbi:MAG: glycine cleavage system protein GcvH [Catenulispora sp.]|nr:glycine cleavage system protein GcvH [Catenulispora sp.]
MSTTPEELKYTAEHEWVASGGDSVRVGITDYAQEALGDIVFVQLPEVGARITAGEPCGELESTKSVSDLYAPLTGTVTAVNNELDGQPELVNSDPYGEGWIFDVQPDDPSEADALLDAKAYEATLEG